MKELNNSSLNRSQNKSTCLITKSPSLSPQQSFLSTFIICEIAHLTSVRHGTIGFYMVSTSTLWSDLEYWQECWRGMNYGDSNDSHQRRKHIPWDMSIVVNTIKYYHCISLCKSICLHKSEHTLKSIYHWANPSEDCLQLGHRSLEVRIVIWYAGMWLWYGTILVLNTRFKQIVMTYDIFWTSLVKLSILSMELLAHMGTLIS